MSFYLYLCIVSPLNMVPWHSGSCIYLERRLRESENARQGHSERNEYVYSCLGEKEKERLVINSVRNLQPVLVD